MAFEKEAVRIAVSSFDELYPGRFIKATTFKGSTVTYRIRSRPDLEELHGNKGPEFKAIITFDGERQGWVVCKTNGICLKAMFGKKLDDWVGKRVTLFAGTHDHQPCIRVWGSPDIDRDQEVIIAHPRKTPYTMLMHCTREQRVPAPVAVAATTSPRVAAYFAKMEASMIAADLDVIEDLLAEDNELTPEETARLVRGLTRRRGQLSSAAEKPSAPE